jgi:adenosine deaminase
MENKTLDFIKRMPKVELHLHLEGTIQPATAIELMHRNKAKDAPRTVEELRRLYRFQDLTRFVQAMKTVSNHIVTLKDLNRVCGEMLSELAAQKVRYVEFDCALQKYVDLGLSLSQVVASLENAILDAQSRYNIQARMVVNLQRSHGSDKTARLVENVVKLNHPMIVGFGLSGDETIFPQKDFIRAFATAKEAEMHRTVHAGEALGCQSVWDALLLLNAERIDHGTRAIEDSKLVHYLIDNKIPLTQCLTSNIRLNIVSDIAHHPFNLFFRSGVAVTLNTDDPQIFQSTLTHEYELAAAAFALTCEEISQIVLNGIRAAFLPVIEKNNLLNVIEAELLQCVVETRRSI